MLLTIADVYGRISEHDEKEKSQSFVNSVDEFNNLITFPFSTQFLGFTILKSKLFWKWKMAFEKSKKKINLDETLTQANKAFNASSKKKALVPNIFNIKRSFREAFE